MNLGTLRTAVYDRLGVPTTDALMTSVVINRNINAALHEIEAEHNWPWYEVSETIPTVSGTKTYAVAADWLQTREVKIASDYPLERFGVIQLDQAWPTDTTTGRPESYAVDAGVLRLYPTPNGVYSMTHRYIKTEADLAADGDTPLMPSPFHTAIAELATYITLKRSKEDARGQAALAAYERWLSKLHKYRRRNSGPVRIRSRWD